MKKLYFWGANPTVDLVIINHEEKILLIKRKENSEACPGMWALPGGFVDSLEVPSIDKNNRKFIEGAETPEEAAIREVKEETNLVLKDVTILPVGIYEGNQRDPRDSDESWSKSHAFFYKIPQDIFESQKDNIRGLDDAEDVNWVSVEEIKSMKLAFDHNLIINDALNLHYNKKLKLK